MAQWQLRDAATLRTRGKVNVHIHCQTVELVMAELDGVICSDVHAVFDIHGAIAIGSHAGKHIYLPSQCYGNSSLPCGTLLQLLQLSDT